MIVAFDAAASWTSYWVMPPTARCTKASFTSSRSSLRRLSVSASSEPVTSALRMRLSVAASPAWICSKMSSSVAPPPTALASRPRDGHPVPVLAGVGDVAGGLLVGGDDEGVAGVGDVGEAEDLDRRRRTGFLDLVALVVDERPHPAPGRTGDERIADVERAPLHEDRGDGAATDVEVRLEHDALGPAVGGGPEVLDVGDEQERLEQVVDAEVLERRDLDDLGVAAPRLRDRGRARRAAA